MRQRGRRRSKEDKKKRKGSDRSSRVSLPRKEGNVMHARELCVS